VDPFSKIDLNGRDLKLFKEWKLIKVFSQLELDGREVVKKRVLKIKNSFKKP
jgi:hypothetical protein